MQSIILMVHTIHRDKESRNSTTGYKNCSFSDLKCGTRHRGYPGKE